MAYNKRNLLLKIIAIQEIVIKEQKRGATQRWIFKNLIEDVFFVSEPAFNKYLARNAKHELAVLDKEEAEKTAGKAAKAARREAEARAQLELFFPE
ncbi:hypothetical protein [Dysgonomonas termitidis]|uniref:Uncharacterized protein n=1 Tax=Dysgonomonas termitidis TaxID=1516126 RepID=A0ABV9KU73_9BACT